MGAYAACWCFTLNNYTDEDCERMLLLGNDACCSYLIYGKEVGLSQTPHLQGFVKFAKRVRFAACKKLLGGANVHVEVCRDQKASIEYCKKDGDFQHFGNDEIVTPGRRCDLEEFKCTVKAGNLNLVSLRELHPLVCAKYPQYVRDYVADNSPKPELIYYPLYGWQADLYARLILPADDRKVIFVVDTNGNTGKSWFARYYVRLHENAQIILPGKKLDMAHVLRCDIRVLFVDAPRSKQGEFVQYDFLEEVKNGLVASYKYESRLKMFGKVHVVVMMNEQPDFAKLSMDRYDVVTIN